MGIVKVEIAQPCQTTYKKHTDKFYHALAYRDRGHLLEYEVSQDLFQAPKFPAVK